MDPKSMDSVESVDEKQKRDDEAGRETKPDASRDVELDELRKPIERRERESEEREHGELTEE